MKIFHLYSLETKWNKFANKIKDFLENFDMKINRTQTHGHYKSMEWKYTYKIPAFIYHNKHIQLKVFNTVDYKCRDENSYLL